jgi:serine/threonine protein kinase
MTAITLGGIHSSLTYDEVEASGPPAEPIDFPAPLIHQAQCEAAFVRDHISGRTSLMKYALSRLDSDRAYAIKKKLAKSKCGCVRLAVVLRSLSAHEQDSDPSSDAQWETTSEQVAIKVSSWSKIREYHERGEEGPVTEVAALQHVGSYHPYVNGSIEALQDEVYLYLVMPYCVGGDLYANRTVLRSEQQIRMWFRQLMHGLIHLQKKGVSHRGISLENLFLNEDNELLIGGFGLALRVPYSDQKNFGSVSDVGIHRRLMLQAGLSGSLTYLAPELIDQDEVFDGFAVDLWSAGVILFVMLVGMAPFRWAHPSDSGFARIGRGELRELVQSANISLSDAACDLLQAMLMPDPRHRLTLSEVMDHPWIFSDVDSVQRTRPAPRQRRKTNKRVHFRQLLKETVNSFA